MLNWDFIKYWGSPTQGGVFFILFSFIYWRAWDIMESFGKFCAMIMLAVWTLLKVDKHWWSRLWQCVLSEFVDSVTEKLPWHWIHMSNQLGVTFEKNSILTDCSVVVNQSEKQMANRIPRNSLTNKIRASRTQNFLYWTLCSTLKILVLTQDFHLQIFLFNKLHPHILIERLVSCFNLPDHPQHQ